MKKEMCEQLYEKLVLYADGESGPGESAEITEHLVRCKDCREMLGALGRSLQTAELIWGSGESETGTGQSPTNSMRNRRLMMRAAAWAACLLIGLGGAVIWWGQGEAVEPIETIKSGVTAAEVEMAADRTAVAAQMLAAADLLDEQPGGEEYARKRYVYLVKEYSETEYAEEARRRLEERREFMQESTIVPFHAAHIAIRHQPGN